MDTSKSKIILIYINNLFKQKYLYKFIMIRVNNFALNNEDVKNNKLVKDKYINILLNFLSLNENSFSEFDMQLINKNFFIKNDKYINYSNNVIFKHDEKQTLFNLIYNNTILNIVNYLGKDTKYFADRLNFMKEHEKNTINYEILDAIMNKKYDELVKYKEQYNKFVYIFLYYTGMQRRLIDFLQNKNHITTFKEFNEMKLGMVSDMFIRYNVHYMYHAINMDRFVNYQRYKDNFKNVYKNRFQYQCTEEPIYLTKDNKITTNIGEKSEQDYTTFDFKIFLNLPEDFIDESLFVSNKSVYINNKSIYLYGQFILDKNKEIHIIPHVNQERLYGLGNIALNIDAMLYIFDLMAYCLYMLDNPKHFSKILKKMQLVEKQIITICLFYYLYILQMPYKEGNAFCAEVSFHALIKKYINPDLVISMNSNIILDVEALLLPFITFYNNCFQSDGTKYTPYFVLNKSDPNAVNTPDNTPDNTPANNTPANNTPANNTPANNTPANNTPSNNTPVNTPANNIIANNIPKKLFVTWYTKNLPPKMQENYYNLCNSNPDFDCKLYDDDDCYNFIKTNFSPTIANTYNKIVAGAYKADLWRYCILYINGGIYCDIKFGIVNNFKLNQLLDKEYFVLDNYLDTIRKQYVYNGFIVTKPRNPKLLKCINQIVTNVKNNYYGDNCLCPTGPGLLDSCFTESEKSQLELKLNCTANPLIAYDNTNILYKNNIFMTSYNEYRIEQTNNMPIEHYGQLWFKKKIYKVDPSQTENTPVNIPVSTPVNIPVNIPVSIPVSTPVSIPVSTPVSTPVSIPVSTPVSTPVVNISNNDENIKQNTLLVRGWRDINHSYSLINQFQLLELIKKDEITLYHQNMPYFLSSWSPKVNNSGLDNDNKDIINSIKEYNNEDVDTVLNITTSYKLFDKKCKNVTFMVVEYTLDKNQLGDTKVGELTENNNIVITPSNWSKNKLIVSGLKADKIFIIPHGVDTNIFKPYTASYKETLRKNLSQNISKKDFVFLNIGGPFHNKGLDVLLNAFSKVLLLNKNVKLIIKYNEELYKISLNNYISTVIKDTNTRNNVINNIILINKTLSLSELNKLYNCADLYISSYRAEGYNIPVLEATAAGLNVLVTEGGSTDDFVLSEQTTKIKSVKTYLDNND